MAVSSRWAKPTLVGTTVTLRPMSADDTDAVWEMVNDPVGQDLTATTASFTYQQTRDWCASRPDQDGRLDLAIVENATGEVVGEAVLNEYVEEDESANFRIALRGPRWFGRGFGTEATRLIVEHGLTAVGLSRIHLGVLARNPRAIAAYEKAGFHRVSEDHEDGETWVTMEITPADLDATLPGGPADSRGEPGS